MKYFLAILFWSLSAQAQVDNFLDKVRPGTYEIEKVMKYKEAYLGSEAKVWRSEPDTLTIEIKSPAWHSGSIKQEISITPYTSSFWKTRIVGQDITGSGIGPAIAYPTKVTYKSSPEISGDKLTNKYDYGRWNSEIELYSKRVKESSIEVLEGHRLRVRYFKIRWGGFESEASEFILKFKK